MLNFVELRQWALNAWLGGIELEAIITKMVKNNTSDDVTETICSELLDLDILLLKMEGH